MTISKRLYANNAKTTLTIDISSYATTILVDDGSKFPVITTGGYFLVTFESGSLIEIVKVTGRIGNSLNGCIRGQEGTTASIFPGGSNVENRITKATLDSFETSIDKFKEIDSIENLTSPITSNAAVYLCHSNDSSGSPIIAIRKNDNSWRLTNYSVVPYSGSVSTSTTTSITSPSLGFTINNLVAGKYVIQFISGLNSGICRHLTGTGPGVASWASALPVICTPGDLYEVYQSNANILTDLSNSSDDSLIYAILLSE